VPSPKAEPPQGVVCFRRVLAATGRAGSRAARRSWAGAGARSGGPAAGKGLSSGLGVVGVKAEPLRIERAASLLAESSSFYFYNLN